MSTIKKITLVFLERLEALKSLGYSEKRIIKLLNITRSKLSNMKRGQSQSDNDLNSAIQNILEQAKEDTLLDLMANDPPGDYNKPASGDLSDLQTRYDDLSTRYEQLQQTNLQLQSQYNTLAGVLARYLNASEQPTSSKPRNNN